MKIRRINLYAGPGVGKSTTSCDVFAKLKNIVIHKHMNVQIELVQEYIKGWAWEKREPKGFDQVYVCAKQMRREEIPLRNGVDAIITDSPLLLQCCYAKKYNVPCWNHLVQVTETFEKEYPSLHIFLERGNRPYVAKGRYQTENGAKELDTYILSALQSFVPSNRLHVVKYNEVDKIVNMAIDGITTDVAL